jgi:hypothetical protein
VLAGVRSCNHECFRFGRASLAFIGQFNRTARPSVLEIRCQALTSGKANREACAAALSELVAES